MTQKRRVLEISDFEGVFTVMLTDTETLCGVSLGHGEDTQSALRDAYDNMRELFYRTVDEVTRDQPVVVSSTVSLSI